MLRFRLIISDTVTAKIRNLKDYHSRIVNSVLPLPNGTDIANTLKYFSQTLIGLVKETTIYESIASL